MTTPETHAGQAVRSTPLFGSPLAEVTDTDQLREMADKLWSLLDDIDTASDVFKPSDEAGYRRFYEYAMKKAGARHAIITSDGYDLYLPNAQNEARVAASRPEPACANSRRVRCQRCQRVYSIQDNPDCPECGGTAWDDMPNNRVSGPQPAQETP
jgi:rubredoxin